MPAGSDPMMCVSPQEQPHPCSQGKQGKGRTDQPTRRALSLRVLAACFDAVRAAWTEHDCCMMRAGPWDALCRFAS